MPPYSTPAKGECGELCDNLTRIIPIPLFNLQTCLQVQEGMLGRSPLLDLQTCPQGQEGTHGRDPVLDPQTCLQV